MPLFPGYFFAHGSMLDQEPTIIERTPGCGRLVRSGGMALDTSPIALPYTAIDWLRERVASLPPSGALPIPALRSDGTNGHDPAPLPGLEAALDGLLSPQGRVAALLSAIGVEIDGEEDEPAIKRPRRTRGHGRKIHYG